MSELFDGDTEALKGGLETIKNALRFSVVLLLIRADMAGKIIERPLQVRQDLLLRDFDNIGRFCGWEDVGTLELIGNQLVLVVDEGNIRVEALLDVCGKGGTVELDVFSRLLELSQELGGDMLNLLVCGYGGDGGVKTVDELGAGLDNLLVDPGGDLLGGKLLRSGDQVGELRVQMLDALSGLTEKLAGVLELLKVFSGVGDVVVVELGIDEGGDPVGKRSGDVVEAHYLVEIAFGSGEFGGPGEPALNNGLDAIDENSGTLVGVLSKSGRGLGCGLGNLDLDGFLDISIVLKWGFCDGVQDFARGLPNDRVHLLYVVEGLDGILVRLLDVGLKTKLNGLNVGLNVGQSILVDGGEGVQRLVDDVTAIRSRFNVVDTVGDERDRSDTADDVNA